MSLIHTLLALLIFPGGLFIVTNGLFYEWLDRKLVARLQNRMGPPWFQPIADLVKLLLNEEIIPAGINRSLFRLLPIVAVSGTLTAMLYIPIAGLAPMLSYPGDLIATIYLLSMLTLCTGLAGANTSGQFALVGSTRTLTQLFAYEAPFLLSLLGPAFVAQSWQMSEILATTSNQWLCFIQPIGFVVALVALMGKLEIPPFDAPEAETEIVAGALTEYSGRGLALFHLGRAIELVGGLTLIAAFYLGGVNNPLEYVIKTLVLLLGVASIQTLMTRLRIDQTVGMWWRYGTLLVLLQWLIVFGLKGIGL